MLEQLGNSACTIHHGIVESRMISYKLICGSLHISINFFVIIGSSPKLYHVQLLKVIHHHILTLRWEIDLNILLPQ